MASRRSPVATASASSCSSSTTSTRTARGPSSKPAAVIGAASCTAVRLHPARYARKPAVRRAGPRQPASRPGIGHGSGPVTSASAAGGRLRFPERRGFRHVAGRTMCNTRDHARPAARSRASPTIAGDRTTTAAHPRATDPRRGGAHGRVHRRHRCSAYGAPRPTCTAPGRRATTSSPRSSRASWTTCAASPPSTASRSRPRPPDPDRRRLRPADLRPGRLGDGDRGIRVSRAVRRRRGRPGRDGPGAAHAGQSCQAPSSSSSPWSGSKTPGRRGDRELARRRGCPGRPPVSAPASRGDQVARPRGPTGAARARSSRRAGRAATSHRSIAAEPPRRMSRTRGQQPRATSAWRGPALGTVAEAGADQCLVQRRRRAGSAPARR